MKGLIKWIKYTDGIKRWILAALIGMTFISLGVSMIISRETLVTSQYMKIIFLFVTGFTLNILSLIKIQKRNLEILVEQSDTRKEKNNINSLIFNKKVYNQGPKVVVIGGGSGLNTVLRGLKHYTDNITAIVTVSDYGEMQSSSNRELQMMPINDLKEGIIALSNNEKEMEELFQHKFRNSKLKGLNFGDIYLAGMAEVAGDFTESIVNSSNILGMTGKVLPVTLDPIKICAELTDGTVIESRSMITEEVNRTKEKINRMYISPTNTRPASGVIESILEADAIIIGPGSLYTNVIPNLLVKGIARAIKESNGIKIYVSNIMTEMGQTDDYKLSDHISAIFDYIGEKIIDYCIYDTGEIIPEFIHLYNLKGADIVYPDIQKVKDYGINLIQRNFSKIEGDLIRHDSDVIASTIIQLICDELVFDDMENNSQYLALNRKLKETEKERRKREKEERKFKESGKKIFERRDNSNSKFKDKYLERIDVIKSKTDD